MKTTRRPPAWAAVVAPLFLLLACAPRWKWQSATIGRDTPVSPADLAVLEQQCSDGSGDVQSCNTAGVVYATGNHGIDEDPTKARRLFSVACAKGLNSACANLQLLESQEAKEIPAL